MLLHNNMTDIINDLDNINKKSALTRSKAVDQYDLNDKLIKTWTSGYEAAKELNISPAHISHCCNGTKNHKTYKGFKWVYTPDPDLLDEHWVELTDELEGLYISNMGRYYHKQINKIYGTIQNDGNLRMYYNKKNYMVAKLVLLGFGEQQPSEKHVAYHIDNDKTNNKIENLRWAEINTDNIINATNDRGSKTLSKKVIQIKDDTVIKIHNSVIGAAKELGLSHGNISKCANGLKKSEGGFEWKYEEDPDLTDEEWKEHEKTGYMVSNKGRILIKRGKTYGILKKNNYMAINDKYLHRLVAETFIDNPENKKTVDHIDGNKQNNCAENLRWATMKEQLANRGHTVINNNE
jgi:biotin operon repressor